VCHRAPQKKRVSARAHRRSRERGLEEIEFVGQRWFVREIKRATERHVKYYAILYMSYLVQRFQQVLFRKRVTNFRALLQKMTYKDDAPYRSSSMSEST